MIPPRCTTAILLSIIITLAATPGCQGPGQEAPLPVAQRSAALCANNKVTQQEVYGSDTTGGEQFGMALAMSGDGAIMGAHRDWVKVANAGAAYIFARSGTVWAQQQKLTAKYPAQNNWFGWSVGVAGAYALVSEPQDNTRAVNAGALYAFTRSGGTWTEKQKLFASDAQYQDFLGLAMAMDSTTALVGSYNSAKGSSAGAVYVFTRSGGTWKQTQKLVASDGTANDQFGFAVALNGDTAVIGAPYDDITGQDSGSAYVFARTGTTWAQQKKLIPSIRAAQDYFGRSVAVSGTTALVGAYRTDAKGSNSGAAWIFTRSGAAWSQRVRLLPNDAKAYHQFGDAVSIDGGTAVVSATGDNTRATAAGAVYVFTGSGAAWTQQKKITATDGKAGDYLGIALANSGELTLAGAYYDDDKGSTAGSAYFFDIVCQDPNGTACTSSTSCTSGNCVDGVCCDSTCGGGVTGDCQACSVAAGAASTGACAPVAKGTSCRAAAGDCDAAEVCDGAGTACPKDAFKAAAMVCRQAAGACDVAETCTGASATCPADGVAPFGTVCRGPAGLCDKGEECSGYGKACPADAYKPAKTVCRQATGDCDMAEVCTGASGVCPADGVAASGTVCRQASGDCDLAEACDGQKKACPSDSVASSGMVCRAAKGVCDKAESCDGTTKACPVDMLAPLNTPCRPAVGLCDRTELCSGSSFTCPADAFETSSVTCRSAKGLCDVAEKCTGVTGACPADIFVPSTLTCRPASGECDKAEKCTGAQPACPGDSYKPDGATCMGGAGLCSGGKCLALPDGGVPDAGPDSSTDAAALPDSGADGAPADLKAPDGKQGDAAKAEAGAVDKGAADKGAADSGKPDTTKTVDQRVPDAQAQDAYDPGVSPPEPDGCAISTGQRRRLPAPVIILCLVVLALSPRRRFTRR